MIGNQPEGENIGPGFAKVTLSIEAKGHGFFRCQQ